MGSFNRDARGDRDDRGPRRSFGGGGRSFGGNRGGFDRGNREMFSAICSNCGKECQVPFRPTNGKPVYCSDCFEKMGNGGHTDAPRFERPAGNDNKAQFDALSAKLDKILNLLQPKADTVISGSPELDSGSKEIKAPKAKKSTSKKK